MKFRLAMLFALSAFAAPAWSTDAPTQAPPSDESLHRLIDVVQAQKLTENIRSQMGAVMMRSAKQALGDSKFDPEEEKIFTRAMNRLTDVVMEQIAWPKMEPDILAIYKKTFTQKEVDDLVAFYQSPSGQAVVQKMPLVMQQSMALGESKIQTIIPQMTQISNDMAKELRAYRESHPVTATQ